MAAQNQIQGDVFDAYFKRADLDGDGRISGQEAVTFFQGSNLSKQVLAQIWTYADQKRTGFLGRPEFYNALKLVTVAQSNRELTPEIVKSALLGPASSKIPPPKINFPPTPLPQSGGLGSNVSGPRGVFPVLPNGNQVQQNNQSNMSGLVRPQTSVSSVPSQPVQGVGFQGYRGGAPPSNNSGSSTFVRTPIEGQISNFTNQYGASSTAMPAPSLPPRPLTPFVSQNGFSQQSQPRKDGFTPSSNVDSVQKVQGQSKPNIPIPVPVGRPSSSPSTSTGQQSQLNWPRPSQTDLQKYTKVFMEVDTDKDGKITGDQARNLFLSWRLPREVLKQVWDLSDQDNDSMLSLREFCIALYLMERYREGRPLPSVLPNSVLLGFPASVQPASGRPTPTWGYSPGLQQQQATSGIAPRPTVRAVGKPPLPGHSHSDDRMPPKPPKDKIPTLEKHLVDQLSEEEQKSLNLKFQEATDANKRVEELEKEIKESREKMEFYQAKMQELVLYKSRCDSRLNEVSERAVADKREVESLAKKYEEKYRQVGGVASKLTIEEATFRDIQEKKMEMYQAISKIEQDGTDDLQARADRIQSSLEELVKSLSERCKKYGLRSKPTTLVELPFGWQPGIQESAADWDEDWDKFEDEGYTFVKDMTLDVQNVIAPPKTKVKVPKKEKILDDIESKSTTTGIEDKKVSENDSKDMEKSSISSPLAGHDGSKDNIFENSGQSDASPHAKGSQSEVGTVDASASEGKSFDEPSQATFDIADNADSAWDPSKETNRDKHIDDLFGHGNWTLPPIKTSSSKTDDFLPKKGIFADSVPSTPADSFVPQKSFFADSVPGTPADSFLPQKSIFADSVPSTPFHGSTNSPQKYGEIPERGFNFSRFDSFRSSDSGFQPQEKLSRFDSMRSTVDFDSQDEKPFQQREAFTRFDSMRSSNNNDFDYGDQFSSFDDSDPFGSGPFKSSFGNETPRRDSDGFGSSAFRSSFGNETPRSEVDAFSGGPFRSSFNETPRSEVDAFSGGPFRSSFNETPRADSDTYGFGTNFGSSFGSETPKADADPFGSAGPFRSSWASETPRSEADSFGGPFKSSFGSETPRRESDYFGYSGSFKSTFGNETPRSEFDSYGFGGPFGSSLGSETPRGGFDAFGDSGPFKSTVSSETPKGRTDSWNAF